MKLFKKKPAPARITNLSSDSGYVNGLETTGARPRLTSGYPEAKNMDSKQEFLKKMVDKVNEMTVAQKKVQLKKEISDMKTQETRLAIDMVKDHKKKLEAEAVFKQKSEERAMDAEMEAMGYHWVE